MNQDLTLWVVDDEKLHAIEAFRVVEKIRETIRDEFGMEAACWWIREFAWAPFPVLRGWPDKSQDASTDPHKPPDIVILDLMHKDTDAEKLEGDAFYRGLRIWESHNEGRLSLVVLWSAFQGIPKTREFVEAATTSDNRVIPLISKQPEILRSALIDLVKRIKEERENS